MTALAITLGVLLLFALTRFGAAVEYCEEGIIVTARIGPLRLRVYPQKVKPGKDRVKKEPRAKAARQQKQAKKPEGKKPGMLKDLLDLLSAARTVLGRLRRRLLISRVTVFYTAAGDDPSTTAMVFGAANAATYTLLPLMERYFRIKTREINVGIDFNSAEPTVYVFAVISLAVWEAVYITFAIVPPLIRFIRHRSAKPDKTSKDKDMADISKELTTVSQKGR